MSSQNARRHYEQLATAYDGRWRRYIDATLDFTLREFQLKGDEDVLDVACGTGELEAKLLSQWPNLSITAVDVCPAMLEQAGSKPFASKVIWHESDATNLPSSDSSIDVIFCSNAFHYFPEPALVLMEFRRVLRPTGRLRIVDWCDDYLTCKLCSLWLRMRNPAFHRTYSVKKCVEMVAEAGFDVRRSERCRINWVWGMMLVEGQ